MNYLMEYLYKTIFKRIHSKAFNLRLIGIAIILFKRFYLVNYLPKCEFQPYQIMLVCIYMAYKL